MHKPRHPRLAWRCATVVHPEIDLSHTAAIPTPQDIYILISSKCEKKQLIRRYLHPRQYWAAVDLVVSNDGEARQVGGQHLGYWLNGDTVVEVCESVFHIIVKIVTVLALCLPQQRPLMCRISAAPWAVSNDGHRCTSAGVCPAPGSLRRISSPASFDPDRDRGRETFVKNEKNITPCSEFSKCSGYYYLTSDLDQEDQLFGVKTSLRSFALTLCKGQLWGKKKETE